MSLAECFRKNEWEWHWQLASVWNEILSRLVLNPTEVSVGHSGLTVMQDHERKIACAMHTPLQAIVVFQDG